MITDIIKQAREMLEKCSDGPWNAGDAEVWRHGDLMSVGICALNFKCENGGYTYFPNSKVHAEFIAFARNNFAAILDEVERLRDALAYCAYNPATNKNWNSLDQLIAGINKVNETARKALEGEG